MKPIIITGSSINMIYPQLLGTIIGRGNRVTPRGQETMEICPVVLHLEDALQNIVTHPLRNLNYSFMVAEWLWIIRGANDVQSIAHYNQKIARFSDDGEIYFGAYGPRILAQKDFVLRKLREDKDTRQAVLTIWRENPSGTKDVPCTVSAQFLRRADRLHAHFIMRSSDAWLGIPYDVFNFSRILSSFAAELSLPTGELCLFLGSSHLYEDNFDDAYDISRDPTPHFDVRSPELNGFPGSAAVTDFEHDARLRGIVADNVEVPLRDYAEALAFRTHKDLDRGHGHIMNIIRKVRAWQPQGDL